jgi:crotonobetainyl-CoA:carnitine CoA-transferase CaiB-like acyl-CoA transferase
VIENFKVGGLRNTGSTRPRCARSIRSLVYCSITGFGQTGPYAPRAGYDFLVQGMGGPMSITGEPDGRADEGGLCHRRHLSPGSTPRSASSRRCAMRDATGEGRDARHGAARHPGRRARQPGDELSRLRQSPPRIGNAHPNIVPYDVVPVADGHIIIATGNDGQWRKLCEVLGLDADLPAIPTMPTTRSRVANRVALTNACTALTQRYAKRSCWRLEAVGVPAGPINTIGEVFADPQTIARGVKVDLPSDGQGRQSSTVASPIVMTACGRWPMSGRARGSANMHDEILERTGESADNG